MTDTITTIDRTTGEQVTISRVEFHADLDRYLPDDHQVLVDLNPSILEGRKKQARIEIDEEVERRISTSGFEFGGMRFSASLKAQSKWHGMFNGRQAQSYPIKAPNIDDTDVLEIANVTEAEALYGTMLHAVKTLIDGGTEAKQAVNAATDAAGVQAALVAYLNP